jgi:NDP-sugar pyrophosphorylase family protein
MINLIPMVGIGSRFNEAGYRLPKPLIEVSGKPMILKVIEDLPNARKWIFVMRDEHIKSGVDKIIRTKIPDAVIIGVKGTTKGQACTCLLAENYLEPEEDVFIASCDSGFIYDNDKFEKLKKEKEVSSICWTFTEREILKQNPFSWGWCLLEEDKKTIKDVSVKKPVSKNPYNDHAITASFWFKKSKDFLKATKLMVSEGYTTNGEFYIDSVPIFLNKLGKKTKIFDVIHYVSWGQPFDLHEYELLEFVSKYKLFGEYISEENKKILNLWRGYFSK